MRTGPVVPGRRNVSPPGPAYLSEGRLFVEVRADVVDVGQRQRCALVGLVEDLLSLGAVQRLGALAAVVVEDTVVGLVVDLPDQVFGLVETVLDQVGEVVALLLTESADAVLALRRRNLRGAAAVG